MVGLKGEEDESEGEREKAGNKAGKPDRKNGEERRDQSQDREGSRIGDEKLPFSSFAVAEEREEVKQGEERKRLRAP